MMNKTSAKVVAAIAVTVLLVIGGIVLIRQLRDTPSPTARIPEELSTETSLAPAIEMPAIPSVATGDAAGQYRKAAGLIKTNSPSSSNLEYPEAPPFGKAWETLAATAWVQNAPARAEMRLARAESEANWPEDPTLKYLNHVRRLANEAGDAAIFAQLHGQEAESLELIDDVRHLSYLIQHAPKAQGFVRCLVAQGVEALAMYRTLLMAPGYSMSDPNQRARIRQLITSLLDQRSPDEQLKEAMAGEPARSPLAMLMTKSITDPSLERAEESIRRTNAERTFAAMSLACQLYRSEKGAGNGRRRSKTWCRIICLRCPLILTATASKLSVTNLSNPGCLMDGIGR